MEKVNLFWAIIWSVMAVLCLVAIFWNPAHFFTLAISVVFAAMFWHDYKKTKDMEKVNLFWAIIWSVMAVLCLVAIFWNPAHFFTLAISVVFAAMFWHDYKKTKGM